MTCHRSDAVFENQGLAIGVSLSWLNIDIEYLRGAVERVVSGEAREVT